MMTQHDPSQQLDESNLGQPPEGQDQETAGDTQRYGQSGRFAASGRLDEGYGQAEEMAEDQWSAERYARGAGKVDRPTLDEGEPQVEGRASDIDGMVGGMIGTDAPPEGMSETDEHGEEDHQT